ncbi:hypothetical protein AGDE_13037 [Angomonas deanei]|uniref:Uncharacterized protein n=1 Tax=Angomonas deanei TaxID=59799 RepID=A0A7G2C883_9TRYP|nr:hypothetical protein AGDE_13037 [Angomonas deanei]CAD2215655.1 hypothetical protein, conserved [Angomonas deanei]|eukprot:EPY22838.1 hypothetical protein AGDE_13037 [Angomonas deanei]
MGALSPCFCAGRQPRGAVGCLSRHEDPAACAGAHAPPGALRTGPARPPPPAETWRPSSSPPPQNLNFASFSPLSI